MNERGKRLSRMSEAKLELVARELERLQVEAKRLREPVAVLGMGCRFPGGANDPRGFWSLLEAGRDVCSRVPAERGWADAAPHGYFLDDVQRFDAALFGVSPREARCIDPQHRLLLEVTWQALEDAGYAPRSLVGSRVGVYVGAYADDFAHQLVWSGDIDNVDAYTSTGTSHAIGAGRIAHVFGLQGPVLSLDTACSSSLVALHLACAALRAGECDLALVGGVSLALSAQTPFTLQRSRMLAPDGRSKTFSAGADGYGRGEGCGVVVLGRSADAERDGRRVRAHVRGSAVNHDGRASSLTAPNGSAQVDVMRRALAAAGVQPSAVYAVECHGTGTSLGDPVEVRALRDVYASQQRRTPLRLSAVKSNVGHLEAAAGIAGFIKMVLALEHEKLPPTLHASTLNPELAREGDWMQITCEAEPWLRGAEPRLAAVSSFGFGGTNAHVVLEQCPSLATRRPREGDDAWVLTLSCATPKGLQQLARATAELVESDAPDVGDLCLSANSGREAHAARATIDARSREQLQGALESLASGQSHPALRVANVSRGEPRILFAFSGQGAQFAGMGRALFERGSGFRADLLRCEQIVEAHAGFSLTDVMYGARSSRLSDTCYAQPALFAFEYALARWWLAHGVEPAATLGHSVGEYVAAHFAGVFDLETALRLVVERGRLMGSLPPGGAMLAVLTEPAWLDVQRRRYGDFEIAALNAPSSVVASGSEAAMERLQCAAQAEGIRTHRLDVSHAFHSRAMDPILRPFEEVLATCELVAPTLPLLSNLTGTWADDRVGSAAYWSEHLRQPVRFADNLRCASEHGLDVVLEIGPSTTLSSLARQVLGGEACVVPSLRAGSGDIAALNEAARGLFLAGAKPSWAWLAESGARRCSFPGYPFAGERYRHPSALKGEQRLAHTLREAQQPPLLGDKLSVARDGLVLYERELRLVDVEPASDHRLFGSVIVPGAYYVAMALVVAGQTWPGVTARIQSAELYSPLRMAEGNVQRLQTLVSRSSGGMKVTIHAAPEGSDDFECHAKLTLTAGASTLDTLDPVALAPTPLPDFYEQMAAAGFELGPRFRWLADVRCGNAEASARIRRPAGCAGPAHQQPGFIDSCFQLLAAAARELGLASANELFVPVGVDLIEARASLGDEVSLSARVDHAHSTPQTMVGDISVVDEQGRTCLRIRGLCARRMPRSRFEAPQAGCELFRTAWQELAPQTVSQQGYVVVGATSEEFAELGRGLGASAALRAAEPAELGRLPCSEQLLLFMPALGGREAEARRLAAFELITAAVRALLDQQGPRPRLRIVTRSGQLLDDCGAVDEGAHALVGLVRSLAFEHPELRPGLIDLERGAALGRTFVAALGTEQESVLVVRGERCLAPRLERQPVARNGVRHVRAGGSYLVTGGLGGLGRTTTRWLLEQGAERVVLLGRRPDSPEVQEDVRAIHSDAAAKVEYFPADVSRGEELQTALARATSKTLPWLGVLHAAGVIDDGVLINQTPARFASVLAPKVSGALNLVEQLRGQDLDWWVFFSSAAGSLGSPGQATYALANAFLDGLACQIASEGQHAVSVAFGPFAEVGMAARRFVDQPFVRPLLPSDLGSLLEAALGSARDRVVSMTVDFAALAAVYPTPRYLERVVPAEPASVESGIQLRLKLQHVLALNGEQRREALLLALLETLSSIVEIPASQLDPDLSLAGIGLDSLSSLELKNAVEKALGVKLSISALLRGPSARELSRLVDAELGAGPPSAVSSVAEGEFLEHLDDAQVAALLAHLTEAEGHVAS